MTYQDIEHAKTRLQPVAYRTPLLHSQRLDEITGAKVFLKAENLQRTGSFKFRGAYNALCLSDADRIVAFSSGNHAQGVACAAQMLGKRATIVMPANAPTIKIERTKSYGADLVLVDSYRQDREEIARQFAEDTGAELIKPFDDRRIIAGQGTAGLEMAEDLIALGERPQIALICTGGGGLLAGCAIALRHHFPKIALHTVEPEAYDDWRLSMAAGERRNHDASKSSICDALLSGRPGELPFAICKPLLGQGLVVSDSEVRAAVEFAAHELKLVVEPGGAAALAAALRQKIALRDKTVLVMISGGNIDLSMLASVLEE